MIAKGVVKSILPVILVFPFASFAFNGHIATEGPLKVTIAEIESPTEFDRPYDVGVTLENTGPAKLSVSIRIDGLIDQWRAVGQTQKQIELAPRSSTKAVFQIAASKGALAALYPVHIYATFRHNAKTATAHAIQVFESKFPRVSPAVHSDEMPVNIVPANGALPLCSVDTHRLAWRFYDKPLAYTHVGFQGSVRESMADFARRPVTRGATKQAIVMHPPWKPAGGTVFAEYILKLPDITPIRLSFANAIRDHTATEPASDGVTFRVWAGESKLFERHTDSKKWLDGEADLSRFAGKEILLRLESHPGPKRNTTCDSSYWAEPLVIAGTVPKKLTDAERQNLRKRAADIVQSRSRPAANEFAFELEGGSLAALVLGRNGLVDSAVAFADARRCVVFDGLQISVLRDKVGVDVSAVVVRDFGTAQLELGSLRVTHRLSLADQGFELTARVWSEKAGLRIALECPKRITDIALGPADQKASRVYYGHGYCIVEPEAFRANFGGHNLSTSHVGFDFAKGLSLLVASDNPPDFLEVNPSTRKYALHTHLNATMTFVPSSRGAFDCARKYRPLYDKKAAPAFERKAGRFVFDIWGGRYSEIAETMKQMIAYGLTDSLLTVHVWQRWGYDYRLPDIYPPQPQLGTVEDMQKIAKVCAERDIPWGLHDNYIDFYPDAEDYSYDHICFTETGQPIKAWINEGRDAQSYRWRPDSIMPFVQRNLKLIKPNLKPTHYFIDVFTSLPCFDYYDREGNFHSMLETRRHWGESFAWIRDYLGGSAPQTSEAGHDQLTGYIEGSDCQHLQITPVGKRFCINIKCKDWQRVPWFDAVLHDKFSLHGVGYSSRYQGDRTRRDHGIESDDYISAEILEGHALMIDRGAFGRGAIRKYWLAQDFVRSIALDSIEDVEFAAGDIHRQIITWSSGAKVYVNRGESDWLIAGKRLPQYGYYAKNGQIESSIERIDGIIVESASSGQGPGGCYFNARTSNPDRALPIRPAAEVLEYLGERRFKMTVGWEAQRPAPKDLHIFIHFSSDKAPRSDRIAFQSGGAPAIGTSKWTGRLKTGENWTAGIPAEYGPGEYDIGIGLWDPASGRRYPLLGDDDGSTRYRLGKLIVEGRPQKITSIRIVKHEPGPQPSARWNVAGVPIDFGPVQTDGALRCRVENDAIVVTPLPDIEPFSVMLRPERLRGGGAVKVESVVAVDSEGEKLRDVDFTVKGNLVQFQTRKDEFAYVLGKDK
ncbi:MAG: hypothetical protein ISS79_07915 [Phycisphaerae bacterium]|nr:hypothetical protein [Phycisphaerae bacterium]